MMDFLKSKIVWIFKEGTFRSNVATMFSGTVVSQIIYLLFYPVLTRIYSPADFGQYALFITLMSILSFIATGQYELSILLPKKEKNYKNVVLGTILLSIVISIFITVILFALSSLLVEQFNLLNTYELIPILGISVLVNAWYQIGIYISLRKKAFKVIATVNIINVVFSILFQYIFSYTGIREIGLIIGYMIGTLVAMTIYFAMNKEIFILKNAISPLWLNIRRLLVRYKDFPLLNLPATLVNLLANQVPQLLLNTFGQAVVGYFALSQRVLGSPITLFSTSVSQVFKEKASSDYRIKGSCEEIFKKTFQTLLLISIVPFILIFIFAPNLVPVIFGEEWSEVGKYIRALIFMYFFKFTVGPLTYVIIIAEKQRLNLLLQSLLLLFTVVSIGIGVYTGNPLTAVLLYSISYSFMYILFFSVSLKLARNSKRQEKINISDTDKNAKSYKHSV